MALGAVVAGCWMAIAAGPVSAAAELVVTIVGASSQPGATLTLVAPGGATQTAADDDGDGVIVLTPEGGAGTYRLTLRAGEDLRSRELEMPARGRVTILYTPGGEGERLSVTYPGANERIVVTARRRQEDLQTTPIAITAFPAADLEERSVEDLSDLGDFVPNLDFATTGYSGGSSNNASVHIRGIGQTSTFLFSDPGVGIYVDGVYLARAQGAVLDLLDPERVEILRGPQGTLFGKNTIGGAIHLITKKPGVERGGSVELRAGNFDRLDGRLHADFPLGNKVYGSLAFSSARNDGFTESLASGEEYFDDDRDTGRLALRFLPGDRFTVDWTADYTRERERAVDFTLLDLDLGVPILDFYNRVTTAAGLPSYTEEFITGDLRRSHSTDPNRSDGEVWGTALTAEWNLGRVDLRSITAYREIEFDVSSDLDGAPVRYAFRPTVTTQDQLSQELQLLGQAADGRLDWVAGALYFSESSHETSHGELFGGLFEALEAAPGAIFAPPGVPDFLCHPGPPPPGLPCFGGAGNPLNLAFYIDPDQRGFDDLETRSYALFGEGTYAVGDRWSVTVGLRFTHEEKNYLLREVPGPGSLASPLNLYNEDSWDALTPRFSLAFQVRPRLFLYASVANGFKSGGFNGLRGSSTATLLDPFDPEKVWAWEFGFKSDLVDNRLRLNGALFWSDYTDLQLTALINAGGEPATLIANAGTAEIKGFELELAAQPTTRFSLTAGVGYTDATYTDLEEIVQGVTLDGEIPRTPEWTLVLSPQYSFWRDDGGAVTLRADYSYRSDYFNDAANSEEVAQEAFAVINARASWILPSGRWELALFATNLTDEEYLENGAFPAGFGPAIGISGRPRQWGVSARFRF